MDYSFYYYIERLELILFFAGYPIVYALVQLLKSLQKSEQLFLKHNLSSHLPYAYALAGSLFLGFVINNMNGNFSTENIITQFSSFIKIWGFLSIIFWVPLFAKKPIYSLLHSLVFFSLIIKDFLIPNINNTIQQSISNDMRMYSLSIALNFVTLFIIVFITWVGKK